MSKFNSIISSFTSGMVSNKFNGRTDLQIYNEAVEELINMDTTSEGGARTRAAFTVSFDPTSHIEPLDLDYITNTQIIPVKEATGACYLFFFYYVGVGGVNAGYTYVHQYKFENKVWTYKGASPFSDNQVSSYTYSKACPLPLQYTYVGDSVILVNGNTRSRIAYRRSLYTAFTFQTLDRYIAELKTTSSSPELSSMNAMHYPVGNKNYDTDFRLKWTVNGSYYDLTIVNSSGTQLGVDVWNTNLTTYITISDSTRTMVFLTEGGNASNTTKLLKAKLVYSRGTTTDNYVKDWFISPWDNINGYPKTVTFFNGKLVFGGTDKFPSTIWCSSPSYFWRFHDFKFYEDTNSDSSGLQTNLDSGESTSPFNVTQGTTGNFCDIRFVQSGAQGLYVGTSGGVELWTSNTGVFNAANNFSTLITSEGAAPIQPVVFSGALVYVGLDRRKINLIEQSKSVELSSYFKDYVDGYSTYVDGIIVNESRNQIIISTNTRNLYSLIFNRGESKWGFSKYILGVNPIMKCLANISEGDITTPFLYCKFSNSLGTKFHKICRQEFDIDSSTKDRTLVTADISLYLPPQVSTTVNLAGTIYANGAYDLVIYGEDENGHFVINKYAAGTYTTSVETSSILDQGNAAIGFLYTQRIKTLDLNFGGSNNNTAISMIKRLDAIGFRVWNTERFNFGTEEDSLQEVVLSPTTTPMLYTGTFEKKIQASPNRENHVIIEVNTPTQLYMSAMVFKGLTAE